MKQKIELHLRELQIEYVHELEHNGSGEYATDRAKRLHGSIQALEWVLKNWE